MIGDNPLNEILEQLPEAAVEPDEFERSDLSVEEMQLGLDEALEVVFQTVPADAFDESHVHTEPLDDAIILHLTPGDARVFDNMMRQFIARHGLAGDTDLPDDPHQDDYCVVCGVESTCDGPAMHPVSSIEDGCVCSDCVGDTQ